MSKLAAERFEVSGSGGAELELRAVAAAEATVKLSGGSRLRLPRAAQAEVSTSGVSSVTSDL